MCLSFFLLIVYVVLVNTYTSLWRIIWFRKIQKEVKGVKIRVFLRWPLTNIVYNNYKIVFFEIPRQFYYLKWFLCFNKLHSIIKCNFPNTQALLEPVHDYVLSQHNFLWGLNNLFQNLGFCFLPLILEKLIKENIMHAMCRHYITM